TLQRMEALINQKFSFDRFLFALNQAGLPNALDAESVSHTIERFGKGVDILLPYEPELPRLMNQGRAVILNPRRAGYAQQITHLAEKLTRFIRERDPFSLASAPAAPAKSSAKTPAGALPVSANVVNKILQEKVGRWNQTKQRLHRDLVEELNVRRIDLDT